MNIFVGLVNDFCLFWMFYVAQTISVCFTVYIRLDEVSLSAL